MAFVQSVVESKAHEASVAMRQSRAALMIELIYIDSKASSGIFISTIGPG